MPDHAAQPVSSSQRDQGELSRFTTPRFPADNDHRMVSQGGRDLHLSFKDWELYIEGDRRHSVGATLSFLAGQVELLLDRRQTLDRLFGKQGLLAELANGSAQGKVVPLHDARQATVKLFDLYTVRARHFLRKLHFYL